MTILTIAERITLHLGRYELTDPDDVYNIPWDLTQDGVASSLRISRAHASIELKKLRMVDKITERNAHIKGGKAKRKAYFLTRLGMSELDRIRKYVTEEGINIMPLLDMRRCDPNALLESFDDESKFVLGLACVIRCSVRRDELPETKQSVVPVDVAGNIVVSDEVKSKVLSAMSPERVNELHSAAADHWLTAKEPDRQERLYHLVKSGRNRDACRLLISDQNEFIDSANTDLHDILSELGIPERFASEVLPMRISIALELGDTDSARSSIDQLISIDNEKGMLHLADLEHASDPQKALDILTAMSDCTDKAGFYLRLARSLSDLSRFQEAQDVLERAKSEMNASGDLTCLNEVYLLLSTIYIRRGFPDDAIAQLNKAKSSAGSKDMKRIYQKLSEAYAAKGMSEEIYG